MGFTFLSFLVGNLVKLQFLQRLSPLVVQSRASLFFHFNPKTAVESVHFWGGKWNQLSGSCRVDALLHRWQNLPVFIGAENGVACPIEADHLSPIWWGELLGTFEKSLTTYPTKSGSNDQLRSNRRLHFPPQ